MCENKCSNCVHFEVLIDEEDSDIIEYHLEYCDECKPSDKEKS
jgi:hypothetical protein